MNVLELRLKVFLLENIIVKNSLGEIAKLIDKSLLADEEFSKIHTENKFKNYVYNSFYPIEKDGVYKKGSIYTIQIRTIDIKLERYFKTYLAETNTTQIKGLTINSKPIKKQLIEKIYSITPAIAKFDDGYWQKNESVEIYQDRIKINLIKKYNQFFNTKLNEDFDFVNYITFINQKPIANAYKSKSLLGDKLTLYISDNERAQKLAYLSLGTGILEMNARGMGFVNFKKY